MARFPGGVAVLLSFGVLLCALLAGLFSLGSFGESPLTGQATHGTYGAFSAPEPGFTIGGGQMAVSDDAVYKTGWFSVNGSAWQQFSLSGAAYGASPSWLSGAASVSLPASLSGPGEHYVIVYTCSRVSNAWDCHGGAPGTGGWQLRVITISGDSCGGSICAPEEYCSAQDACLLSVPGNTYFVAVDGDDSNPGNFTHPWKTWQKGMTTPLAGDIVYFRGGVYYPDAFASGNNIIFINPSGNVGHNGAPGNPIRFFNYPGEEPVLDCKNLVAPGTAPANRYISGIIMYDVHWIDWRGLTVRNVLQREANVEPKGIVGYPISNMNFERMTVHNIGGAGWYMHSSVNVVPPEGYGDEFFGWDDANIGLIPYDNTRYVNCDTYNCCDFYPVNDGQTPGNLADGFKTIANTGANISYEGCRAWNNSDDGFDLPTSNSYVRFDNCWSFDNLYPGAGANYEGNGLKLAAGDDSIPQLTNNKIITNSIFVNCDIGIYYMDGGIHQSLYYTLNNLIYRSKLGIQLRENIFNDPSIVDMMKMDFHNNIISSTTSNDAAGRPYDLSVTNYYTESHNTWDYADSSEMGSLSWWKLATDITVTDDDFISSDSSQLYRPRKADGSLPDIEFGHLAPGSDLIDAGTLIPGYHCATAGAHPGEECREWYGAAPDLGPFEYQSVACVPTTETCNNADDDCDGAVDDGVASSSRSCSVGVGACLRTGTQSSSCAAGVTSWGSCSVVAGSPGTETCNNLDDDCDGAVDDGVASSRSCTITNGVGSQTGYCSSGTWNWNTCTVTSCNSGYIQSGNTCVMYTPPVNTGAIIADHTAARDFDMIPACWIEEAKRTFLITYHHTSHGSQIYSGMNYLKNNVDSDLYNYNDVVAANSLFFADHYDTDLGNGNWPTITRSDIQNTPSLNTAMWSWCGQVGGYTTYEAMSSQYLAPAENIVDDYAINYIYMTGHLDAGGSTGSAHIANNIIRQHVEDIEGILFDFEDIERYDPDGNDYLELGAGYATDGCLYNNGNNNWCEEWCDEHPSDCVNLPGCAHSHGFNCVQKGKAFWWMMARMAGWDGVSTTC